jgi:hypothetical protein
MKLKQLGSNMTELDMGDVQVFFSYDTPVAARLTDGSLVRTDQWYSASTSKHTNKWLGDGCCDTVAVPQSVINELVEVV